MRSQAPPSNGGPPCPHGHALQRLACVARDARGRACLLGAGAPAHLGELLAPARVLWQESRGPDSAAAAQLLGLLLVLRNLCAAGSAATAALLRCSAPAQVAALVLLLAPRAPPPAAQPGSAKLLVVAAQLLANLAASSAEAARSVWAACEPGAFLALARVPDGSVHGPLCRALHLCSLASAHPGGLSGSSEGGEVLHAVLLHAGRQAEGGGPPTGADHAAALVGELALERGLLPWLLRATDAAPAGARDTWRAQEALLRLLAAAVDERAGRLEAPAGEGRSGTGMDGLAASLQALVTAAASHAEAAADGPGRAPVLRAAMAALRSLSSVEAGAWRARLVEDLRCAGAVAQLLAMLAALGPATRRRPAPHPGAQQPVACAAPAAAGLRPELADRARGLPSSAPYIGYRTDAAAVLANLLYAAPSVQRDVLELGGVAVLLSQCQVDDQSPWVREWALWGVRNMCEGNAAVQAAIAELQPRAPVASPELDALNMRVELDQATGKFSLVRGQAGAGPVD